MYLLNKVLQVLSLNLKKLAEREIDSLLAYQENQIPVAVKYTNCHEFLARQVSDTNSIL